jgi:hypothetical protein
VGAEGSAGVTVPKGGAAVFTRYLVIVNGDAGPVFAAANELRGKSPTFIGGEVTTATLAGETVGLADGTVAVLRNGLPVGFFLTDTQGRFRGQMEPGEYDIAVYAPGHAFATPGVPAFTTVKLSEGEDFEVAGLGLPPKSTLTLFLRDISPQLDEEGMPALPLATADQPTAGRVTWERLEPDPSPLAVTDGTLTVYPFRPLSAQPRSLTVGPRGEGKFDLAPGTYRLRAYRGPFDSSATLDVTLRAGHDTNRILEIGRVVAVPTVTVAEFGGNSQGNAADAILRALAEGVDLLVLSDAGRRTDAVAAARLLDEAFATPRNALPVTGRIAVATGETVATPGYGRFAAWPTWDPEQPWGFVVATDGQQARYPREIIADLLAALPQSAKNALGSANLVAEPLVRLDRPFADPVDHEILANAYFDTADASIDWETGAIAAPGRINRGHIGMGDASLWTAGEGDWTALDVLYSSSEAALQLSLNAWFSLLNLAYNPESGAQKRTTVLAMANGGAGEFADLPAGKPRNFLAGGIARDQFRSESAAERFVALGRVNDLLRDRRNVMSTGPWLDVEVRRQGAAGDAVTVGGFLVGAQTETVTVTVSVKSPCWAPFDTVDYYLNTMVEAPVVVDGVVTNAPAPVSTQSVTPTVENALTGLADADACRADGTGMGRYVAEVSLDLDTSAWDSWVVVKVSGQSFLPPLHGRHGALRPVAISNPVFVDRDGNFAFAPLCPSSACPQQGVMRLGHRD